MTYQIQLSRDLIREMLYRENVESLYQSLYFVSQGNGDLAPIIQKSFLKMFKELPLLDDFNSFRRLLHIYAFQFLEEEMGWEKRGFPELLPAIDISLPEIHDGKFIIDNTMLETIAKSFYFKEREFIILYYLLKIDIEIIAALVDMTPAEVQLRSADITRRLLAMLAHSS